MRNSSISVITIQSRFSIAIVLFIIACLLVFINLQHRHAENKFLDNQKNSFLQKSEILDNSIGKISTYIEMENDVTDSFLSAEIDSTSFLELFQYNEEKQFYSLCNNKQLGYKQVFSSIATSNLDSPDELMRFSKLALKLQEYQRAFQNMNPNVVLSYYVSDKQSFTEIYPPLPLSEVIPDDFASFITDAYEVYNELAPPSKNPSRSIFWTSPYIDRAGNGMMVTCAVPIYYNDTYVGVLGSDILLTFLGQHTSNTVNSLGHLSIISDDNKVISSTDINYENESEICTAPHIDIIKNHSYDSSWSISTKGEYIIEYSLKNAPWTFQYIIDQNQAKKLLLDAIIVDLQFVILSIIIVIILTIFIHIKLLNPGVIAEQQLKKLSLELEKQVSLRTQLLKDREENLKITLNSIADAVVSTNIHGEIEEMNPVAENLMAVKLEEVKGTPIQSIFNIYNHLTRLPIKCPVETVLETGKITGIMKGAILVGQNGSEYQIADSCAPIVNANKVMTGVILVFRDISEEEKLEKQLQHSQKMDAVGQLAGGVAHDFNNMLSGILGAAELIKVSTELESSENQELLNLIITTSERSAELTSKLLAFSRQGEIAASTVDIHKILGNSIAILIRSIDKRINIHSNLFAEILSVVGDNSALQNLFMNLGINASHAMPEGGSIEISTRNVYLDDFYCSKTQFDIQSGNFIEIEVKDTGSGISPENLVKIFDPFFTTKEKGKGTGLGLAAAYGTINKHHGEIIVESEIGEGTSFRILLPTTSKSVTTTEKKDVSTEGIGTILLVDDEEIIRITGKHLLEKIGYTVILAEHGLDALHIFKSKQSEISLIISDMNMPKMNGSTLFKAIQKIDPELPFIISSGFTKDQSMKEHEKLGYINKPFRISELSNVVSKYLS